MSPETTARRRAAPGRRPFARCVGAVVGSLAVGLSLSACTGVESPSAEGYQPASVEEVEGLEVSRVTFTQEGADRVDLETTSATEVGGQTAVDYAALIYDGQGVPWVYTIAEPLTFVRAQVVVDRIDADQVILTSGLDSGTEVVTVGAAEVYGAELDIAGGH